MTGEEEEEVEMELKGAKVFVKRGSRDFCEGILGNVKLLKRRDSGEERVCSCQPFSSFSSSRVYS